MPRHSRVKSNTNVYHVMCRALNKQLLFEDEIDYLIDYTDAITNLLVREELEYSNVRNSSYSSEMFGDISSRIIRYTDFYNKEKTGGELDMKQDPFVWDKAFNNALGFTDDELFYGGGVARMLVDRNYDNIWNSLITDKYYGDKPEDIEDIMKGISLYNKLHLNIGCGGAR